MRHRCCRRARRIAERNESPGSAEARRNPASVMPLNYGRTVYVVDGRRTPILKASGSPGPFSASDLAVACSRDLILRHPRAREGLQELVWGCVMPSEFRGKYLPDHRPSPGTGPECAGAYRPAQLCIRNAGTGCGGATHRTGRFGLDPGRGCRGNEPRACAARAGSRVLARAFQPGERALGPDCARCWDSGPAC